MSASSSSPQQAEALQILRELLVRLDPEAEVRIDEGSGEVLVRGDFQVERLNEAIERAGLDMRAATSGDGCCGNCGCG